MSNYALADTKAQWYQDDFPGSVLDPNVVVLHTTEGSDWPGYSVGAVAPNYTAKPDFAGKRLRWRAHFPDERSSRALRNLTGGVETNTLNVVQVELIGTCDLDTHKAWTIKKVPHIYWPDAPDWALRDLGAFLADMHKRHGVKLQAPEFLAYPQSYGASRVRFSGEKWRGFYGVCGHQHVPENVHGDPGALPIGKVLAYARGEAPAKPAPLRPTAVTKARDLLRAALRWSKANNRPKRARKVQDALDALPKR